MESLETSSGISLKRPLQKLQFLKIGFIFQALISLLVRDSICLLKLHDVLVFS